MAQTVEEFVKTGRKIARLNNWKGHTKTVTQLNSFIAKPIINDKFWIMEQLGKRIGTLQKDRERFVFLKNHKEYFESYLHAFGQGNFASTINLIIKRDIIVEVGYFAEDQKRAQDTDMWLRIAYRWPKIGYVNEPLAIYHRGVEGSITKTHTHSKIIGDLVARHLNLSAEQGKLEDFQPCGSKMLQVWMREVILHQHRSKEVLDLVERFKDILPFRFKNEMRLRTRYPRLAPYCLGFSNRVKQIISRFKNRQ